MTITSSDDISFAPALGSTVSIPSGTTQWAVYAISAAEHSLSAGESIDFTEIDVPFIGNSSKLRVFRAIVPVGSGAVKISVDGTVKGSVNFAPAGAQADNEDFCESITLDENEEFKRVRIPWIDVEAWYGWAWYRIRETWIEAFNIGPLSELSSEKQTHFLLLQSSAERSVNSGSQVFTVYPASSQEAFVTLQNAKENEPPGTYAHVRRVKAGGTPTVHVTGAVRRSPDWLHATHDTIAAARDKYGIRVEPKPIDRAEYEESPFGGLGFCTWSSIGEHVPLTKSNITDLVEKLSEFELPIASFIIDDGWQNTRRGENGGPGSRGLYGFDTWDGMGADLGEIVSIIRQGIPSCRHVGVWLTLYGYWNTIAPSSPLAAKYEMKKYQITRDNVGGLGWDWEVETGSFPDPKDRWYLLPPPSRAYDFYRDYFSVCKAAGVTFVKIDNQAYGSHLEGVEGGEEFVAMWNAMYRASNEIFGELRVINCMAHSERTYGGDIGLGGVTQGKRIVIRNSDDFGLPWPNVHRNHAIFNVMNAVLTRELCLIPDVDMHMTSAQWPEFHSVLRAYFEGPLNLADKPGKCDTSKVFPLIASNAAGQTHALTSSTVSPVSRTLWEPVLGNGLGPSIKVFCPSSSIGSANLVYFSSREDASSASVDALLQSDITEVLGDLQSDRYAIYFSFADSAVQTDSASGPETIVAAIEIAPTMCEVATILPLFTVGDTRVGCAGLVDKYATLAAITSVTPRDEKLIVRSRARGTIGFVSTSQSLVISEGSLALETTVAAISNGLWLHRAQLPVTPGGTEWEIEVHT